ETRQGLFDMPAFIKSTKDNKKLYGKTAFCLKIYLKLMDVGSYHMPINLKRTNYPKTIKSEQNVHIFRTEGIMRF
ncbi:hypothetical protein, partial [Bacillus nitratireducens]|uniref:hypothetical protein n=1 Tax=Bacillus nitratireducens TaxID=2026193 RepID=UPI0028525EB6